LRVLVFTPSYPRYLGDYHGSFIQGLCGRLAGHVDLTVLAPRSRTMKPFTEPYPVQRFPYLPRSGCELLAERTMLGAPAGHMVQLPMYLASAYLHAVRGSYDLVHTHLAIPLGVLAAHNPRGTPQLVTCHGSDCTAPAMNGCIAPAVRHALGKADRVVAVSESVRERALRLGARPNRSETIYTGVDVERFRPPAKRGGTPTVGVLCRMVPDKRVEEILLAVRRLQRRMDAKLLIGGEGPHLPSLMGYASRLGLRFTRFLGRVGDAPGFHRLCGAHASASTREGLSTSIQEAMASGCVPVAPDTRSSRELIENGVNGLLYRPGDAEGLSRRLEEALNSTSLGVKARDNIVSRFNLDRNYVQYLRAYEEAVR